MIQRERKSGPCSKSTFRLGGNNVGTDIIQIHEKERYMFYRRNYVIKMLRSLANRRLVLALGQGY